MKTHLCGRTVGKIKNYYGTDSNKKALIMATTSYLKFIKNIDEKEIPDLVDLYIDTGTRNIGTTLVWQAYALSF